MKISEHAVKRFRDRTGATYSDVKIFNKLQEMYSKSKPVRLKPQYRAANIINNNFRDSEFHLYNGVVLVTRDDTLITFINYSVNKKFEEI